MKENPGKTSFSKKHLYILCLVLVNIIGASFLLTTETPSNSLSEAIKIKNIVCKEHGPISLQAHNGKEYYSLYGLNNCSKDKYVGVNANILSSDNIIISMEVNGAMLFNEEKYLHSTQLALGFILLLINVFLIMLILKLEKPNK